MQNKELLKQIASFSERPEIFAVGDGNIWTEPYLAQQMLSCHLDLSSDASSRRGEIIERSVQYLNRHIKDNSSILDLGCGPGLYCEKLAQLGHQVTGVDFSQNSIQYAKDNAKKQGLEIEYFCQDIFSLEYKECFDAVLQIYGEINTLSDSQRDQLFSMVKNALRPGGVFIFDVTTPVRRKNGKKRDWYFGERGFWRENKHVVLSEELEYDNDIWLEQYLVIDEEKVRTYRNWYHEYTKESMMDILRTVPFSEVIIQESLYTDKNEQNSEWLTIVAKKEV